MMMEHSSAQVLFSKQVPVLVKIQSTHQEYKNQENEIIPKNSMKSTEVNHLNTFHPLNLTSTKIHSPSASISPPHQTSLTNTPSSSLSNIRQDFRDSNRGPSSSSTTTTTTTTSLRPHTEYQKRLGYITVQVALDTGRGGGLKVIV